MSNLDNCKSVSVTHRITGEVRTYFVNSDGTEVYAAHATTGEMKQLKISTTSEGYKLINFNSTDKTTGKKRVMSITINVLVWSVWCNQGVYLGSNGFDVDHIDDDNQNNNFTNLQRITKTANLKKRAARRARIKAIEAELVVLPDGDITFEPMKEAA